MDYQLIYNNIINNALTSNRSKGKDVYYERHHIIPKCLGGTNDKDNLVNLTAREHFIAHRLLCKIYPDNNKLKFAFWSMCNQLTGDVIRDYKVSSRTYAEAKELFRYSNLCLHSNKQLSIEHIEIIRARMLTDLNPMKGKFKENNPLYNKRRSIETKSKISNTKLNNPDRNASYNGDYITPAGIFKSARQAATIFKVSADVIRARCKTNSNIILTKRHINNSIGLDESMIGFTFKQLGWDFLPLLQK